MFLYTQFSSFFFTDPATTEIYTLSLHDALPISDDDAEERALHEQHSDVGELHERLDAIEEDAGIDRLPDRSEEHTSELQSHSDLVCRLLLEKKKNNPRTTTNIPVRNTVVTQVDE